MERNNQILNKVNSMTKKKDNMPILPKVKDVKATTDKDQSAGDNHENFLSKTAILNKYQKIFEDIHKSSVLPIMENLIKSQERMKNLYKIPNPSSDLLQSLLKNQKHIKKLYEIPAANIPDLKTQLPNLDNVLKNENFEKIQRLIDKQAKLGASFKLQEPHRRMTDKLPPPANVITNRKLDELIDRTEELVKAVAISATVASKINDRADQFINEFKIASDKTDKAAKIAIWIAAASFIFTTISFVYDKWEPTKSDPQLIKIAEEIEKLQQIEMDGKLKEQSVIPYIFNSRQ